MPAKRGRPCPAQHLRRRLSQGTVRRGLTSSGRSDQQLGGARVGAVKYAPARIEPGV